jgi:hypothetical protein
MNEEIGKIIERVKRGQTTLIDAAILEGHIAGLNHAIDKLKGGLNEQKGGPEVDCTHDVRDSHHNCGMQKG